MTTYTPSCPYCRDQARSYRIACQGCQVRRAVDMTAYHKGSEKLPEPSKPLPPPKIAP